MQNERYQHFSGLFLVIGLRVKWEIEGTYDLLVGELPAPLIAPKAY